MKSAKTVLKLFKGCHIDSYDVIEGVMHVFNVTTKQGAKAQYRLMEDPPNVMYVWSATIKEQSQAYEIRKALISLIDENTIIWPKAALRLAEN